MDWTAHNQLSTFNKTKVSKHSYWATIWTDSDWFVKVPSWTKIIFRPLFLKTQTSTWLQTLTEVKRKRRRKSTPPKRKISTFTKEPQEPLFLFTLLMVIVLIIFRQRKRYSEQKNMPIMRSRNLHGPTLGQILLWIMPHHHQDGCWNYQKERINHEKEESRFVSREKSQREGSCR